MALEIAEVSENNNKAI